MVYISLHLRKLKPLLWLGLPRLYEKRCLVIIQDPFNNIWSRKTSVNSVHRAELCDTSGIFTGAMALNLKDRDDKGHDTMKKNGRIGKDPPAFLFFHSLTI